MENNKQKPISWKNAIIKVLQESQKAMHISEIADAIIASGYRPATATPANTVGSIITKCENVVKTDEGYIFQEKPSKDENKIKTEDNDSHDRTDIIVECFGRYWLKHKIDWSKATPDLLGQQTDNSSPINFNEQIGIYILHQGHEVVYVGQAIKQPIIKRLRQHTSDQTRGRWDRFSWFGFYPVDEKTGKLKRKNQVAITTEKLADTIEAILIECFEPGLNKKTGNNWGDENDQYFQSEDEDFELKKFEKKYGKVMSKLFPKQP